MINNQNCRHYKIGDEVLLKNRELLCSIEGIARKLLLLYTSSYIVTAVKGLKTCEISDKVTKMRKGVYNYTEINIYNPPLG